MITLSRMPSSSSPTIPTNQQDSDEVKNPIARIFVSLLAGALVCAASPAQLSGTYVIDHTLPTGGGVYGSFADAVADLVAQGVGGPVTFEVFDTGGPFTEVNAFNANNVGTSWAPLTAVVVLGTWA